MGMPDPGKVLVTGATGFIGYEVARQLCARGLRPRLLVRRPLRATLLHALDAEPVQGDLESPPSLERAVEGVDTILHLGARAIFEEYELVRPTIVDGSVALMRAAAAGGVRRFVYTSSLLVYSSQEQDIDRDTPATTRLGYGRAKLEAEAVLSDLAREAGMTFAAIRLPHVYGARDLMFDQLRRGRVVMPGAGRNRFAHLHVEDAARVLLAVVEQGWSGISPVGDDLAVDWNGFFAVVKEYYPRLRHLGVPRWLALLGTRLLTPYRRLSRYPSLHTPDAVRGWNLNVPVRKGLLWDELGLAPEYATIHRGIPAVLDDCVEFRWIHPVADRLG
jgi:nucleoside-diphosphate-sugar epimerase